MVTPLFLAIYKKYTYKTIPRMEFKTKIDPTGIHMYKNRIKATKKKTDFIKRN